METPTAVIPPFIILDNQLKLLLLTEFFLRRICRMLVGLFLSLNAAVTNQWWTAVCHSCGRRMDVEKGWGLIDSFAMNFTLSTSSSKQKCMQDGIFCFQLTYMYDGMNVLVGCWWEANSEVASNKSLRTEKVRRCWSSRWVQCDMMSQRKESPRFVSTTTTPRQQ